jgi:hypothetical protein
MSYKFQRLREKLREAIRGGEFAGKLPGERALAKRFGVNAKTLSKALTDLAAEGLLDRSIGRGTYVKGTAPAQEADGRWLVVCDAGGATEPCIVAHLRDRNPLVESVTDVTDIRPSFLNQFQAVIDASPRTPEPFLRNLVVRNVPVVAVGHEPRTYSVHAVLPDAPLGVAQLGRELLLAGHRRVAAVEVRGGATVVSHALRQAAARYAPDAVIDGCAPEDVAALLDEGATAVVCDSPRSAEQVAKVLAARGAGVPAAVSLAAVGCVCDQAPCSGYYVPCKQLVDSVVRLLRDPPARPAAVWLAGEFADLKTMSARAAGPGDGAGRPAPLHLGGMLV